MGFLYHLGNSFDNYSNITIKNFMIKVMKEICLDLTGENNSRILEWIHTITSC